MIQNRYSSPLPATIPDEDTDSTKNSDSSGDDTDNSTESEWWHPQNQLGLEQDYQLGLEPEDRFGFQQDDQVVALDEKGEIKHHEAIEKY
jgi:hypothetical protein